MDYAETSPRQSDLSAPHSVSHFALGQLLFGSFMLAAFSENEDGAW